MSNYCTNCKFLGKETNAGRTNWFCRNKSRIGYMLQSLCGNPTKLLSCINENWHEDKNKCKTCNGKLTETIAAGYVCFKCNDVWKTKEKKMTTEEMIKVMQAYTDGKQIQYNDVGRNNWDDCKQPIWHWREHDYRIKPEPKYRPLKPEELVELKGKWLINKIDKGLYAITGISNVVFVDAMKGYSPEELFESFTYEDETPIGKLEE